MKDSNLIVERENRNSKLKQSEAAKWELIRRLRYGALLRLFRHRWGHVLPDDDAGRDDLWLLVTNVSLAATEPEKKMRHVIEMWAPRMPDEEREAYFSHVWSLDRYERIQTAGELGKRLGLTNAEREALKLWQFLPIDKTEEEIAQQAKARERERNKRRRRANGAKSRDEYLASLPSRTRPWEAENISRRTWERRRAKRVASPTEIIVFKMTKPGIMKTPEVGKTDSHASSRPELRSDPASTDDRIVALGNWDRATQTLRELAETIVADGEPHGHKG